jgi:hypothetical protein
VTDLDLEDLLTRASETELYLGVVARRRRTVRNLLVQ